jgi:hypothetical protein
MFTKTEALVHPLQKFLHPLGMLPGAKVFQRGFAVVRQRQA